MTRTVAIIQDRTGRTCAVYDSEDLARVQAEEYNRNPRNDDGTPDEERPYTVERWVVQ